MKTLLKNGTLIDYKTNTFEQYDILINEDKVGIVFFVIEFLASQRAALFG